MEIPEICRYCGGTVRLVPASMVYGAAAAKRLKLESEKFYQCQNCNARVGCHKGTTRPLGNLANEVTAGIHTGRRTVTASARKPGGCSYADIRCIVHRRTQKK